MTLFEFYGSIEAQGVDVPELDLPDKPEFMMGILEKFFDLHRCRAQGFNGPLPLTYRDMMDWEVFTEWATSKWEWGVIRDLDAVYLSVIQEKR